MYIKPQEGRSFIGRFESGEDLLASLNDLCKKENIRLGVFNLIGAVRNAKLGYYDQEQKQYTGCVEINKKLEISSCTGNISIKDGEIFVHAHITLADFDGKAFGGI
ncbi:MAG: DNA-binding protein [Candidatus Saganbacteria bacterium]|nr:DNA-binding protein [Candidatus Saganbacteria bacterium]